MWNIISSSQVQKEGWDGWGQPVYFSVTIDTEPILNHSFTDSIEPLGSIEHIHEFRESVLNLSSYWVIAGE